MNDVPTDGNWLPWIITIGISVIMTLGTTIVGLARMIKETYVKSIEDLTTRVNKLETSYTEKVSENTLLREENAKLRAKLEVHERVEF